MKKNINQIISNTYYSTIAQVVSLIVSFFLILIVPKYIAVEPYRYWQLYLLYASYAGLLHFGLIDGIYLRYGGVNYEQLDKEKLRSQFWILLFSQILFALLLFTLSKYYIDNVSRNYIFTAISIYLVLIMLNTFFLFIFQCTNRIKEYVIIVIIERTTFLIFITTTLLLGIRDFKYIIVGDLFAKLIALIPCYLFGKSLVVGKIASLNNAFNEAWANLSIGIKLLFSNIAGLLIIGIFRFSIEQYWGIEIFGKISLTLSISNILMVFIGAVSVVIFPVLKQISTQRLTELYNMIRNLLMLVLVGMLIVYFPLRYILGIWLPTYDDKLVYLVLLFPICLFESKMTLLVSTYLKALRKEALMLKINLISVSICIISIIISVRILNSLNLTIISLVFIFAFRCIMAEIYISNYLNLRLFKDILLELTMTFIFILSGWYLNFLNGLIVYFVAFSIYLILKRKDFSLSIKLFKHYLYQ